MQAASRLLNAILTAAIFVDLSVHAWVSFEALRIWLEHGPSRTLVGPASAVAYPAVVLRDDHAAGYRAVRRVLALGEARGYEPDLALARFVLAIVACWFEPIEDALEAGRRAREGLIAAGDLAYASETYYPTTVPYALDCAPTLDHYMAEMESGLALTRRTGNEQTGQAIDPYRWLAGVLRGEIAAAAGETDSVERYAGNPLALLGAHLNRGIAATIFGDPASLTRYSAAAMPLVPVVLGSYLTGVAYLLRGLALAGQAGEADGEERDGLLSELDEVTRWLAARAADAPDNFLHLLRLIEAERAWAVGDFRAAVQGFDAARREVGQRQRPWHRALISERAARFYLAHGVEHVGYELLAQARNEYLAWGAIAKVNQMDWAYPTLRPPPDASTEQRATTGTIDLLGILSASRALSSETSMDRLQARVAEVLRGMTGATSVHLLLWSEDRQDWLLPHPGAAGGHEREQPMSVLRYAQRTREPLVVADATGDDRFARDPYFIGVDSCSLLALPILSGRVLRAVLVLENRLIRGAFSNERLDTVKLIAGQLAVSLENAQLYAELGASRARVVGSADEARRRIERDLHDGVQQRLVSLALQLRAAQAAVPPGLDGLEAELDGVVAGLKDAFEELLEVARGIHPSVLADGGLGPALKALVRRSSVPVEANVRVEGRLPEPVEVAAYYVVSEALTNAAKHAEATRVDVDVDATAHVLQVRVNDDGVGGADVAGGSGLVGLKDRVEAIGGTLSVQSRPGHGTRLDAELPLEVDRFTSSGSVAAFSRPSPR